MWLKVQLVLLCLAMAFANCQCLAACIEAPDQGSPSPCHQQQHDSKPCAHATFVAEDRAPAPAVAAAQPIVCLISSLAAEPAPLFSQGAHVRGAGPAFHSSPPIKLSTVLRV